MVDGRGTTGPSRGATGTMVTSVLEERKGEQVGLVSSSSRPRERRTRELLELFVAFCPSLCFGAQSSSRDLLYLYYSCLVQPHPPPSSRESDYRA